MISCPRCAALALVLLALAGCDSNNPSRDLDLIEGVYALEELIFDPVTTGLPNANVGARLDLANTTLEIFGNDETSLLRVRERGAAGNRRIDLRTTAARGRATFEAVSDDDRDDLARLFLPRSFTLVYDGDRPRLLTGEFRQSGVNLEAFDPSVYQEQRSNSGTLTVAFRRP